MTMIRVMYFTSSSFTPACLFPFLYNNVNAKLFDSSSQLCWSESRISLNEVSLGSSLTDFLNAVNDLCSCYVVITALLSSNRSSMIGPYRAGLLCSVRMSLLSDATVI